MRPAARRRCAPLPVTHLLMIAPLRRSMSDGEEQGVRFPALHPRQNPSPNDRPFPHREGIRGLGAARRQSPVSALPDRLSSLLPPELGARGLGEIGGLFERQPRLRQGGTGRSVGVGGAAAARTLYSSMGTTG